MNSTGTRATWTLTGLHMTGAPIPCDHCSRQVKRGFVVADGDRELRVGRGCLKGLTGWTLEWADAKRQLRAAEYTARRAEVAAEFPTLTDAQVGDVAGYDFNWRTGGWRAHAERFARMGGGE